MVTARPAPPDARSRARSAGPRRSPSATWPRCGPAYWVVMISGFVEPVLYLFSIGVGVGALVGDLDAADGRGRSTTPPSSRRRCSPSSAMTGALAETTFNFFGKMKYMKLYDGDARHPGTAVRDRARRAGLGDAARLASTRRAFLVRHGGDGPDHAGPGAAPRSRRRCWSGSPSARLGMALSTFMRGWQDFDLMFVRPVRAVPVLRHVRAGARTTPRCCAGWSS